jgi:hypothetical protein
MTIKTFIPADGINATAHRKERNFLYAFKVVTFDKKSNTFDEPIDLRVYGTSTANYVCLWVHAKSIHASGSARATGYGYHRPSEAAELAFDKAGITLPEHIGGRGDSAIEDALTALALHLGYKKESFTIIKSHP